jgi:rhodanese-related sulfurtransferase
VAQELIDIGFKQVWALKGGWVEWEKAGYPTEPK